MTGPIASLNAALRWDLADFDRGTRHIEMSFQKLLTLGRDLAVGFQQIGQRMTLGITAPMVALGGYTVKAASDLQELQSAFDFTFGASAKTMNAWAESTGNAMGRATSEMQKGALAMGQLFKQAAPTQGAAARLSQQFTTLAQDAASFYNTDFDVALGKIRSGLSGESEPLRDFGVFLNEAAVKARALELGLAEASQELTEQNKIMARASLISEGLADATGDVERTSGSLANRMRALKGTITELAQELGARLLPYAEKFVGWAQGAAEMVQRLPKPVKDVAVGLAAFAAALGPVSLALSAIAVTILPLFLARLGPVYLVISAIINPIGTLIISLGKLGVAWGALGVIITKWGSMLAAAITPANLLISAFALGLGYITAKAFETRAEIDSLGVSLEQSNASLASAIERARAAGVDIDKLGDAGRSATDDFFGLAKAFKMASDAAAELASNAKLAQLAVLNQTRAEQERKIVLLEQKEREAQAARPFGVVSDALRKIDPIGDGSIERARDQARRATQMELSAARMALENVKREIAVTAATPESAFERPNPQAPDSGGGAGGPSGGRARRVTQGLQDQLELRRQELKLEQELAVARERGDVAEQRRIEKQFDIQRRTQEYIRLEYSEKEAIAKATADIAEIEAARSEELARQVALAEREFDMQLAELRNDYAAIEYLKDQAYLEERVAFWKSKQRDDAEALLLAQRDLATQADAMAERAERDAAREENARMIELARLRGDDPRKINAMEEAQRIRDRADQLQRDFRMDPEDAMAKAMEEGADRSRAALQGTFRDTFRAGLQAAMNGDLGGFFKNWLESRAFDALTNVLDRLADGLANLVSGGGSGGGGFLSILGSALGLASSFSGSFAGSSSSGLFSAGKAVGGSILKNLGPDPWLLNPQPINPGVPRFANGGWGTIKGRPGIDTNTLSLNGNPIAQVSDGELLNVQQAGAAGNGLAVTITMDRSTGQFGAYVRDQANRVVAEATPRIAAMGASGAIQKIGKMNAKALA